MLLLMKVTLLSSKIVLSSFPFDNLLLQNRIPIDNLSIL